MYMEEKKTNIQLESYIPSHRKLNLKFRVPRSIITIITVRRHQWLTKLNFLRLNCGKSVKPS